MKLSKFLTQASMRGGTEVPAELDPLLLIITRIAMNRYSLESRALRRTCLAVIHLDPEVSESDIWALGTDARGLFNAFAMKRLLGEYQQADLDMLKDRLIGFEAG